MNSGELR